MGLTKEEKAVLERLTAKADEPDEPPMGKSVSFSLDLGDTEQIKRAISFGLLSAPAEDDDDDDDKEKDKDATPKRRGYFKETE